MVSCYCSTSFDFILNTASCSTPIDEDSLKDKISLELALSDPSRVSIVSASCDGTNTVARVRIGPSAGGRRLRHDEGDHTFLSAFYYFVDMASGLDSVTNDDNDRTLMSMSTDGTDTDCFSFSVGNMELIPGESDVKTYRFDAKLTLEEEMIMAATEGCYSHHLEERQQMVTIEDHLN